METDRNPMTLADARDRLAGLVQQHNVRFIFAETCTAGLCSATMAQFEGISPHLCGSAATYIPELKRSWLHVSNDTIEQFTCESQEVADAMAVGVLNVATVANWSAAVVGHLSSDLPCHVYVAIARRNAQGEIAVCAQLDRPLNASTREARQAEAAAWVLLTLAEAIESAAD
jgi:PncC family amidohydrolase